VTAIIINKPKIMTSNKSVNKSNENSSLYDEGVSVKESIHILDPFSREGTVQARSDRKEIDGSNEGGVPIVIEEDGVVRAEFNRTFPL